MKIFILSFLTLFSKVSAAQGITKVDEHINIKAPMFQHYAQLYSFNVNVYKKHDKIKIVYSVLDSISAKNMFQIFLAYGDTAGVPTRNFLNIDSIAKSKNLYKKDSIEFNSKNNSEYSTLIDSCFLQNAHQFDSHLPSDYTHVGGVFYHFIFQKKKKTIKTLSVITPTKFNYPFLANLLKETFKIYKSKSNDFLNNINTEGKYYR